MPKVGMQPIRRKQLINATIQCIYYYGLLGTTVKKVSETAGVSTGIINHYFGSKDDMLQATMREILRRHKVIGVKKLSTCTSHDERIRAIIDINFSSEQTDPATVCTWLAFWAQAMHVPALSRLQRINTRRLYTNLLFSLKQVLPSDQATLAAEGLAALIDGLWLRGAFKNQGIDAERAQQVVWSYYQSFSKTYEKRS